MARLPARQLFLVLADVGSEAGEQSGDEQTSIIALLWNFRLMDD